MIVNLRVITEKKKKNRNKFSACFDQELGSWPSSDAAVKHIFSILDSIPRRLDIGYGAEEIGKKIASQVTHQLNAHAKAGMVDRGSININVFMTPKGKKKNVRWAVDPEVEICL